MAQESSSSNVVKFRGVKEYRLPVVSLIRRKGVTLSVFSNIRQVFRFPTLVATEVKNVNELVQEFVSYVKIRGWRQSNLPL